MKRYEQRNHRYITHTTIKKGSKAFVDVVLIPVIGTINLMDRGEKIMKRQLAKNEIKIKYKNKLAT